MLGIVVYKHVVRESQQRTVHIRRRRYRHLPNAHRYTEWFFIDVHVIYAYRLFIARQHPAADARYNIDIPILSVRPSVCPSVTRWYCMKTAQHVVIVFFHHTVAQSFQFYEHQTPSRGAKDRLGIKIRDFLPISHYISQTIQDIAMVIMEGE